MNRKIIFLMGIPFLVLGGFLATFISSKKDTSTSHFLIQKAFADIPTSGAVGGGSQGEGEAQGEAEAQGECQGEAQGECQGV